MAAICERCGVPFRIYQNPNPEIHSNPRDCIDNLRLEVARLRSALWGAVSMEHTEKHQGEIKDCQEMLCLLTKQALDHIEPGTNPR